MPLIIDSNSKKRKSQKRTLSRVRILKVALKIADKEGLAKLSMRKLATKFDVEAMSLYNHVKNKEDILNGIVDLIFKEIDWLKEGDDWKSSMRKRADSTREVLKKHPWAIALLESRPNPGPITLKYHDQVIGCLRGAGFSLDLTAHAFSVLDAYTYGFVMEEQALPFQNAEELKQIADMILGSFPKEAYPNLFEFTKGHVLQAEYSHAKEFSFGLELILGGLEQRFSCT